MCRQVRKAEMCKERDLTMHQTLASLPQVRKAEMTKVERAMSIFDNTRWECKLARWAC